MWADVYVNFFFSGERIVLEIEIWKPLMSPCSISGVTGDEEKPRRVGGGKWPSKACKECQHQSRGGGAWKADCEERP